MPKGLDDTGMSVLEQELEREMSEDTPPAEGDDLEIEMDEAVEPEESELLLESEAPEEAYGYATDTSENYAERLYELSLGTFESEREADEAIDRVIADMERDYFWGSLKKKLRKLPIKKLVRKGLDLAAANIPAVQALKGVTQLARGDLRGALNAAAKAGLGAAIPGAGTFLPATLTALGFEATEEPADNRDAWDNLVLVSKEAYEHLAENLNDRVDDPLEASRQANEAFRTAMRNVQGRVRLGRRRGAGAARYEQTQPRSRLIVLRPGERLVIRAG